MTNLTGHEFMLIGEAMLGKITISVDTIIGDLEDIQRGEITISNSPDGELVSIALIANVSAAMKNPSRVVKEVMEEINPASILERLYELDEDTAVLLVKRLAVYQAYVIAFPMHRVDAVKIAFLNRSPEDMDFKVDSSSETGNA